MKDLELKAIRDGKRKASEAQDLAGEQEWIMLELAWLEEQVEATPRNAKRMRSLLALLKKEERKAKRAGDFQAVEAYKAREEEIELRLLERNPENQSILKSLRKRMQEQINRARQQGDTEAEERYQNKKNELEKRIQPREKKARKPESIRETLAKYPKPEEPVLVRARTLIYEGEDVIQIAEEVKRLMEGEPKEDLQFLLAELYYHTGFTERAQKSLKAYKKELGEAGESVKLVNLGLAVAMNSRATRFNWDDFWRRKAELERPEQDRKKSEGR